MINDNGMVTVCSACKQASCWKGIFFCDESLNAGTVDLSVAEVKALKLEHSDYWDGTYEKIP